MFDKKYLVLEENTYDEALNIYKKIVDYIGLSEEEQNKINPNFFKSPASSKYHNNSVHGLFFHSINVSLFSLEFLNKIYENKKNNYLNKLSNNGYNQYKKDTMFAALFHDYLKCNRYIDDDVPPTNKQLHRIEKDCINLGIDYKKYMSKLTKNSASLFIDAIINNKILELDNIVNKNIYRYNSDVPDLGHGEASVIYLLQDGFKLTYHQMVAIRYHMISMDDLWSIEIKKKLILDYTRQYPMLSAIFLADLITGLLYE